MKNINRSSSESFINIGSSSLLVIFLVLALVTFSVLSLSTAQSDYSFSRKLAERKSAYYEASNTAEEILSDIDDLMAEAYAAAYGQDPVYLARLRLALSSYEFAVPVNMTETAIDYTIPINDSQSLAVQLHVNTSLNKGDAFYSVMTWETISTTDWTADNKVNLIR